MATAKTFATKQTVSSFLDTIADERKRNDSFKLVEIMTEVSGWPAVMWGPAIVGFGSYHYKYESGHEGDAPMIGFSPRKAALTLYLANDFPKRDVYLEQLGKHSTSKACIYIKTLSDIHLPVLEKMIGAAVKHSKKKKPQFKS